MATQQPPQPTASDVSRAPSVSDMIAACAAATALSTPPGGQPIPGVNPGVEPEPAAQCERKAA